MRNLFVDDDEQRFSIVQMLGRIPEDTRLVCDYDTAVAELDTDEAIDELYLDGNLKDPNGNGLDLVFYMINRKTPVGKVFVHSADDDLNERMVSCLKKSGYTVTGVDLSRLPRHS